MIRGVYVARITSAYRVTCMFPRVKCYEEGQELYELQRDLKE